MKTKSSVANGIIRNRYIRYIIIFVLLYYGLSYVVGYHNSTEYMKKYFGVHDGVVNAVQWKGEETDKELKEGYLYIALKGLPKNVTLNELKDALSDTYNVENSDAYRRIEDEQNIMKAFYDNVLGTDEIVLQKFDTVSYSVVSSDKHTYSYVATVRNNGGTYYISIKKGWIDGKYVGSNINLATNNGRIMLMDGKNKYLIATINPDTYNLSTLSTDYSICSSCNTNHKEKKINKREINFYTNAALHVMKKNGIVANNSFIIVFNDNE